jgi:citrate synthase
LTGEFPTPEEFQEISEEFKARAELTDDIKNYIKSLPTDMHPMTQLSSTLLFLQPSSKFNKAVRDGINQSDHWEYILDDSLTLLAKIPRIAAYIYRHTYKNNEFIEADPNLDWAGNYAHMMGYKDFEIRECIRGYLSIHS